MTDLTRESKATALARAERDPEFVLALLDELAAVTQENKRLRGLLHHVLETGGFPCTQRWETNHD